MSTHAGTLDDGRARTGGGLRWILVTGALAVTLAAGVATGRATAPGSPPVTTPAVARVVPDPGSPPGFPGPAQRAQLRASFHGRAAPGG
jgi:hypothetical protein